MSEGGSDDAKVVGEPDFNGLTFDDDEDEQMDDDTAGVELAEDEDEMVGSDEEKPSDPSLCACCQAEPKVPRNIYGAECKKALNNTEKREATQSGKKGERWAKWCEVKRAGGAPLFAILMAYRAECERSTVSGKARGNFDWMQHYEEMRSVAEVKTGERLIYMTFKKWLTVAQEDHAMDVQEAKKKWIQKKLKTPPSKKRKSGRGILLLPMPKEFFIEGSNANQHLKGLRLENNKIKKPQGKDLEKGEKHVTSGHLGFSDKAFAKVGGADLVDSAQAGTSLLFAPDGDSIFGDGENFRKTILVAWPQASALSLSH